MTASRVSVLIRSPGFFGVSDGDIRARFENLYDVALGKLINDSVVPQSAANVVRVLPGSGVQAHMTTRRPLPARSVSCSRHCGLISRVSRVVKRKADF